MMQYQFFLKTSPKELALRLYKNKEHRPMISHLQSKQELEEYVGKHLFERLPFYLKAKKLLILIIKVSRQ